MDTTSTPLPPQQVQPIVVAVDQSDTWHDVQRLACQQAWPAGPIETTTRLTDVARTSLFTGEPVSAWVVQLTSTADQNRAVSDLAELSDAQLVAAANRGVLIQVVADNGQYGKRKRKSPHPIVSALLARTGVRVEVRHGSNGHADMAMVAQTVNQLAVTQEVKRLLLDQAGGELHPIARMVANLKALPEAQQRQIRADQVACRAGQHGKVVPWALTDAITTGDIAGTARMVDRLEETGTLDQAVAVLRSRITQAVWFAKALTTAPGVSFDELKPLLPTREQNQAWYAFKLAAKTGEAGLQAVADRLDVMVKAGTPGWFGRTVVKRAQQRVDRHELIAAAAVFAGVLQPDKSPARLTSTTP